MHGLMRTSLIALVVLALGLAAVPALAATRSVRLVDNRFAPKSVAIERGDTVRFRHAGRLPHNVTVERGPARFASPLLRSGGTYRKRLTRRGRYLLVCTLHPGMEMTLRVR